jgi:hypothetical protein
LFLVALTAALAIAESLPSCRVTIPLQVSSEDLTTALHSASASTPAAGITLQAVPKHSAGQQPPEAPPLTAEPEPTSSPARFEITHVEAIQPRIIRILNLDEGPREIVLLFAH